MDWLLDDLDPEIEELIEDVAQRISRDEEELDTLLETLREEALESEPYYNAQPGKEKEYLARVVMECAEHIAEEMARERWE